MNRPVSIGLLPIYSIDPSQHNDTSVRSSVRTTEGLDSHGSGSSQTPECIPGRSEYLPVPRGVEDKCGDNIFCNFAEPCGDAKPGARTWVLSAIYGEHRGNIQGSVRPVINIQNNSGNFFGPTLIVVPLTTKLKKLEQPTHCVLKKQRGLNETSMSEAEQIVTINFFFDTYTGYFIQALPIALVVGTIYGFIKFRADRETPICKKLFSCVFVCYITGLVCLVVGLDLMGIIWYKLLYHMDPGRTIGWFGGCFDLVPDFFNNISGETIGNFSMFLPFGILYPLSQKEPTWKKCVIRGLIAVVVIEVLQPIFGRAFDMNDIILNSLGIVVSTTILMSAKKTIKR